MECFDAKLLLRQKKDRHGEHYPVDLFGHLCVCRRCWTYANYLWHEETRTFAAQYPEAGETYEQRLDQAWNTGRARHLPWYRRPALLNAVQPLVLAVSGVIFFLI